LGLVEADTALNLIACDRDPACGFKSLTIFSGMIDLPAAFIGDALQPWPAAAFRIRAAAQIYVELEGVSSNLPHPLDSLIGNVGHCEEPQIRGGSLIQLSGFCVARLRLRLFIISRLVGGILILILVIGIHGGNRFGN
jgi:hypothetical protein